MATTTTPRANNTAFEPFEKRSPTVFPKLEEVEQRKRRWCSPKVWAIVLMVVGSLTAILGILYGTALPAYVNSAVDDEVVHCSDSDVSKQSYVDPYGDCDDCSPYYVSVYMLNATNAEDYLATNAKLQVREMGPYVYRRREIKMDVPSCDGCSESDEIVSFDTGYFSVIAATGGEYNLLKAVAQSSFLANKSLSVVNEVDFILVRIRN
ncbi:hypothetical protein PF001_g29787 [Phytophthora fragariae]|uniref:Uncharacterized protein n=1 Tax=Phytophthora fragariae TaxID=53985 RepID=A0A6A3GKU0_9STRA|nr:hypothetical protein PF003_g31508 [Phytophthora fragariae]KAE8957057.1 hypothetical protein PF011_g31275 [Phytophthora fragariae]KAE9165467.1 hypothetical protein PF004_g29488 [Phytophthora fragariae]KAE9268119.1 hypothetical protein PF001_g29787 [Phytophthora fragariae]